MKIPTLQEEELKPWPAYPRRRYSRRIQSVRFLPFLVSSCSGQLILMNEIISCSKNQPTSYLLLSWYYPLCLPAEASWRRRALPVLRSPARRDVGGCVSNGTKNAPIRLSSRCFFGIVRQIPVGNSNI